MYVHLCKRPGEGTSPDVRTKKRLSSAAPMYVHRVRDAVVALMLPIISVLAQLTGAFFEPVSCAKQLITNYLSATRRRGNSNSYGNSNSNGNSNGNGNSSSNGNSNDNGNSNGNGNTYSTATFRHFGEVLCPKKTRKPPKNIRRLKNNLYLCIGITHA